jgi:hypothetical protein
MYGFKRLIISLTIFTLLFSTIVGCSNVDQESTKSQDDRTNVSSLKMESWIGDYSFSEYAPQDKNMFYSVSIYEKDGDYYADINILGFQTSKNLQAKVSGNENSIKLSFYKYLPDNVYELYNEGDILMSFEKKDSVLYTYWGKIQPMLESNYGTGKVCFNTKQ